MLGAPNALIPNTAPVIVQATPAETIINTARFGNLVICILRVIEKIPSVVGIVEGLHMIATRPSPLSSSAPGRLFLRLWRTLRPRSPAGTRASAAP